MQSNIIRIEIAPGVFIAKNQSDLNLSRGEIVEKIQNSIAGLSPLLLSISKHIGKPLQSLHQSV